MRRISFVLLLLAAGTAALICPLAFAEPAGSSGSDFEFHDYRGTIGAAPIGMTIAAASGKVTGNYFYVKWLKDIPLEGTADENRNIVLWEMDGAGHRMAEFRGKFPEKDPRGHFGGTGKLGHEVIVGSWKKSGSSQTSPVYLASTSSGQALVGEGRYTPAGAADDFAVEWQVKAFRSAAIEGRRTAVAELIHYPVRATINHRSREIGTRAELLKNYGLIFTPRYIGAVRDAVPHAMFARDQGIMLGDGCVWFVPDGKAIALNN